SGSYTLSGNGNLNVSNEYIGNFGSALFTQSGGTKASNGLTIGFSANPSSIYNLSGTGVLKVAEETIGLLGTNNQFNQTGGTHIVGDELDLGLNAGSSGTYSLSGGTASAISVYLGGSSGGAAGTGILSISGAGSLSTNSLAVINTAGSIVNLSG